MKTPSWLFVALACCSIPARSAPPAPPKNASADQKLFDRYTAALGAKFGFSPWTVDKGTLTASGPSGKLSVELKDAKTEADVEAGILQTLPKIEKREAGPSKIPVYFVGAGAADLFKGAVSVGDANDLAANEKSAGNDYAALLDLRQGIIFFPTKSAADIHFAVDGKPARRVVIRRREEDKALVGTMEGDDYSYAVFSVSVGGKASPPAAKAGAEKVFFEFNAWMQKAQKGSDARFNPQTIQKLSDGGYRHPQFEKLMAQVQGGMTADKLAKAYDAAGTQAPADMSARAQALQDAAGSGYGGAAHWKINSNGKYADKDGNMTLLVRANGPAAPGGKIEELPITVKKGASAKEMAAAVDQVTQALIKGDVSAAKAQAMKTAVAATPTEVVDEVATNPLTMFMPGSMGLLGPVASDKQDPLSFLFSPTPFIDGVASRNQSALKTETDIVASACGGKTDCTPTAPIIADPKPAVVLPPKQQNVASVVNAELSPGQKTALQSVPAPPAWVGARPSVSADGLVATATDCVFGMGPGLSVPTANQRVQTRLNQLRGARSLVDLSTQNSQQFKTKDGLPGACVQMTMTMGG